jgi:hypothetical protein
LSEVNKGENIVAGMSIGGGKRENFFFCLLEHFPDQNRWFLTNLKQVRDESFDDSDRAITNWVNNYGLTKLVIDFPLSKPVCETCQIECPGTDKCSNESVVEVRQIIEELITIDTKNYKTHPKSYEKERLVDGQVNYSESVFSKKTDDHLLSKPFKRKLKKGFLPYWNRPLDVWIWKNYYDQLLNLFKVSYDSFGNTSLMLMSRFKYLLRHFPVDLRFYETDVRLCLLELFKSNIITKNHLINLNDLELSVFTKIEIIKCIENKLGIFIYQKDVETIAKNPKAFDSFLLAIAGQRELMDKVYDLPEWSLAQQANFIIPDFE